MAQDSSVYRSREGRAEVLRLYDRAAVRPIFTEEPHDEWTQALGAIFRHVRLETRMPRLATADEMSAFRAPTMVVASEDDPFFPANRVLPKAAKILPHAEALRLEGERHLLSDRGLRRVNEIVARFVGGRSDHSDQWDAGSSV